MMMTMMMTLITKSCTTSRMALGTLARFFVRIVTTIIVSIAHLPAQYTAIVRLTTKLSIRTTACFCYSNRHLHRQVQNTATRRALGTAHVPPTKVFRRLAVNKTIFKPRLAAATGGQYVYVRFSRRNKIPRCSAYTIPVSEKAIRFRHPDYNPNRAQKLISSSMSRHLSIRNISSKSMHAFLSNFANRQTDKRSRVNAFTASFVGGKNQDHTKPRRPTISIFHSQRSL